MSTFLACRLANTDTGRCRIYGRRPVASVSPSTSSRGMAPCHRACDAVPALPAGSVRRPAACCRARSCSTVVAEQASRVLFWMEIFTFLSPVLARSLAPDRLARAWHTSFWFSAAGIACSRRAPAVRSSARDPTIRLLQGLPPRLAPARPAGRRHSAAPRSASRVVPYHELIVVFQSFSAHAFRVRLSFSLRCSAAASSLFERRCRRTVRHRRLSSSAPRRRPPGLAAWLNIAGAVFSASCYRRPVHVRLGFTSRTRGHAR